MKSCGLSGLTLCLGIAVAGCSREAARPADTSVADTANSDEDVQAGVGKDAWTYRSKEYGFSLNLPAGGWKQTTKKKFIADFWCRTRTGSPMLAAVTSVTKQTKEQFRASMPQLKAEPDEDADYLVKPTFQEGATEAGNEYLLGTAVEKGSSGSQFLYVTRAWVWVADKGITVATFFEGQGQMRSKLFKSIESSEFESTAKSICLSPK
jgi:hypothetical protein